MADMDEQPKRTRHGAVKVGLDMFDRRKYCLLSRGELRRVTDPRKTGRSSARSIVEGAEERDMGRNGRIGLLFACAAEVTACGGGGGSSSPSPPALSVPVAAAVSAYAQANHTFNLAGSVNGVNFTIAYTYAPGSNLTFQGQATATATEMLAISGNGATQASSWTDYLIVSPYKLIGQIEISGANAGQWVIVANQQALPAMASTGQNGPWETSTTYKDSALTTVVSTEVDTWSLISASSTTAWFCDNAQITPASGTPFSGAQCWQIDQSGNVLAMRVTLQVNGVTVTFQ